MKHSTCTNALFRWKKPVLWLILTIIAAGLIVGISLFFAPKAENETSEDQFGFTATTTFSDVTVNVLDFKKNNKTAEIRIRIQNRNDESLSFGEEFQLLRWQDGEWKDWKKNGEYVFDSILHTLDAGKSTEKTLTWTSADTAMEGKYRIEFAFELFDDWDKKSQSLVGRHQSVHLDFEVKEDWGIPNYTNTFRTAFHEEGPELKINYVSKRFALLRNGTAFEVGTYSQEELPGFIVFTTDGDKKYYFTPSFRDWIRFIDTHSDPMPLQIREGFETFSLSFLDKAGEQFQISSQYSGATVFRYDTGTNWSPELWLCDFFYSYQGKFYIWNKPVRDGGIDSCIQGEYTYDRKTNLLICTATDGNSYRFQLSEIKNAQDQENVGYRPLQFPIYIDGTAPLPFEIGKEIPIY